MYKFYKFGRDYSKIQPEVYKLFEKGLKCTEISKKLNIDRRTVGKWLKQKGYKYSKYNKANINSAIFNNVDNEEKAYWLGFIFADGYVSKSSNFELSLGLKDLKHLKKFKNFLEFEGNIYIDNKVGRCRLQFQDSKIVNDLKSIGCVNNKSLILKFPNINDELTHHFIRGYFDGDGCINKSNTSMSVSVIGTYSFISQIHNILNLPKDNIKHRNIRHSKYVYTNQLSGQNARNFCRYIYKDSTIFLERKYNRFMKHLQRFELWNGGTIKVDVLDLINNKVYKFNSCKECCEYLKCAHSTLKSAYNKNKILKKRYKILKYE